jgi:hypothetical protein
MPSRDDQRMYRFDLLDRTGVFLGFGLVQLALLGAGGLTSTTAVTAGLPLPVAAAPVVLAAGLALGRVGGERLVDLVPVVARWIAGRRRRRWLAPLHLLDPAAEPDQQPSLPPVLAGIHLLEAPGDWGRLAGAGVVHDTSTGAMSAVVRVRGQDFALAPRDEQVRLLAGWGDVLAAFATERGAVARLSWTDFTTPTGMRDHLAWLASQPATPSDAFDSYRELLDGTGALSAGHDVLVTVTVTRERLSGARNRADVDERLLTVLGKAVDTLVRGLRTASLLADDPLTAGELAAVLRGRMDPSRMRKASTGSLAERLGLVQPANAGPMAVDVEWSRLRTDGAWHRTYWIAEWPRLTQHPDWMEPVLAFVGTGSRTLTVLFEPVAPSASRRRVDRDSIKLDTDATSRAEHGRRVDAGHRRLQAAVAEREAELVAGYAEVAYAGVVTVTAGGDATLRAACDECEQVAREHGLELRPLDGRQDVAFAAALPLGLGLSRTWVA